MKIKTPAIMMLILCASAQGWAFYAEGYYEQLDGKTREDLKAAAKECVATHQKLGYTDLPVYWESTDVYPDLYDDGESMCKRWWEMYSDKVYLILPGQTARGSFSANKMQREHAVPKSWWKSGGSVEYTPAYSDLWNLFPSDGTANGRKSNYPLGTVREGAATFDNGVTKVGPVVAGQGGGSGIVFEPADEYKGDFARSFFYVATVYDDLPWAINYMYESNSWPTLRSWAVDMLLEWARQDPVSDKETERNDAVEKCQGNRNPYVDFPDLAEYVWGSLTDKVFYIAEQGSGDNTGVTTVTDRYPDSFEIGFMEGGFVIVSDGEFTGMRVYDISGRMVLSEPYVSAGEMFSLPRGVYVIVVDQCSEPKKIIVR